jgi:hypothetical protein
MKFGYCVHSEVIEISGNAGDADCRGGIQIKSWLWLEWNICGVRLGNTQMLECF